MAALPEVIEPGFGDDVGMMGPLEDERPQTLPRSADLLGNSNSQARKWLRKRFEAIPKGFEAQLSRSDAMSKWWNCYDCVLDDNQFYDGNAAIYVPIIRDAINARTTRFANQLFPTSGRCIEVSSSDGKQPSEIIALIDHYIRDGQLKTRIVRPLLRNGDVEGQYNLYVSWNEIERQLVTRVRRGPRVMLDEGEFDTDGDEIEDVDEEDITEGAPFFEVLHDPDVLVLPATVDSVEEALQIGGLVAIVRRWSKEKLEKMIESGEIRKEAGEELEKKEVDPSMAGLNDVQKKLAGDVGIRAKGPHTLAFEVWQMMPLNEQGAFSEKGTKRLVRTWYSIDREPIGCHRNPYWNDRCPLLSAPVEKIAGVFKGKSLVEAVAPLQYEANDAANERADADHYAAMPIIARDPSEGTTPLVLNLAAVWDVAPEKIKFLEFPDLSGRATARVMAATSLIFQSLNVNPSMLPQQSGKAGTKRNQAEVAMEQQVDLLTTAEAVLVPEQAILTPLAAWMVDLDYQYRKGPLTVRAYGEMGIHAEMIDVPPLQNRTRYEFIWAGAQQARNAAMFQQQIAFINVVRGMQDVIKAAGYRLNVVPPLEAAAQGIFGARTAPLLLIDERRELTVPAETENELLAMGHEVFVHPLDNDAEHLQEHMKFMQATSDPQGNGQVHMQRHMQSMQMKLQAQAAQQMAQQQGAQGVPGGSGPGVPGTPRGGQPPRMGAQPAQPRMMKGPPGMIRPDAMPRAGAVPMPRRM